MTLRALTSEPLSDGEEITPQIFIPESMKKKGKNVELGLAKKACMG
jgi:hypothetical protein